MTSKKLASVCAACAAAGIAVLCTAGVIAYATGNPYEIYRTALLNTATAGNMTVNANFSIKKDGLTVADGNALYQQNESAKYSDVNAVISGQQITRQEYSDQNIKIKSDGTSYSQKLRKNCENENDSFTPSTLKLMQMTADMLVGDLSTQFSSDGDTIYAQVSAQQVPEIANTAVSAAEISAKNSGQGENAAIESALSQIEITQNVKIEDVTMSAVITDSSISSQEIDIILSGQNAAGESSQVEITVNADVTNVGSTAPQSIDTASMQETASLDGEK